MTNRIFKAVEPFAALEARVLADLAALDERTARLRAKPEVYRSLYDDALKNLQQHDMLSLDKAAERMRLTPAALLRKADRGQAVLIEIEGQRFVPDWTLDRAGRVKSFHLAIAREFAESGQNEFFKFMSYMKFMSKNMEMGGPVQARRLPEIFRAAGVKCGQARVILSIPMAEIMDRAPKNNKIMAGLIAELGSALTRIGGMGNPNEGGISEAFLARYVPADIPDRDRWKREIG